MSNPTTPFGWQMPENTDLVTDLPADFEVFGQAVATDLQYLLGGTTGQLLSKASGTDLDFDWASPASGGGMTLLSTTTLTGSNTTITSISQDYNELHCYIFGVTSGSVSDGVLFASAYNGATGLNAKVLRTSTNSPLTWIETTGFRLSTDTDNTLRLKRSSSANFWKVIFANYTQAAQLKSLDITGGFENTDSVNAAWSSRGAVTDTSSANIDSLQIIITGGNTFTTGTIKIYGVK